jgi:nucleotide sugar dehydrogenase
LDTPVDTTAFLRDLRSRKRAVGIWGCGAIGSSAAYYLGRVGLRCIGYDIVEERVREIREGRFQTTSAHVETVTTPEQPLDVTGTTRWRDLEAANIGVHLVCVPTERAAEPSSAALEDVMPRIARVVRATPPTATPPLVSIESTILPRWLKEVVLPALRAEGLEVGRDVLVGAAPRRDWFNGADYTIETLPRIVGGCDAAATALLVAFYSLICRTVYPAIDAEHAAFTKVIENLIRYQGITLGNTLALAFPQFDMRHILRLASTKWNIPYYYPSLGIGGHCIPLAPQYVLEESDVDNPYLQPVRDAIAFNEEYFSHLLQQRLQPLLAGKRSVGVLGLAYTPDAKMHKLSPAFAVLDALRQTPRLRLHDPYYSVEEIDDLCSVPAMNFPQDLPDCDVIVLVTAHSAYLHCPVEEYIAPGTVIIDNVGAWRGRTFATDVRYYEVGRLLDGPLPDNEPYSTTAD